MQPRDKQLMATCHEKEVLSGRARMTCTPGISKPRSQWKTSIPHLGQVSASRHPRLDFHTLEFPSRFDGHQRTALACLKSWKSSMYEHLGRVLGRNCDDMIRLSLTRATFFWAWREYARMRGLTHFHNTPNTSCKIIQHLVNVKMWPRGCLPTTWHNADTTFSLHKVLSLVVEISKSIYNARHKWTQTD